MSSPPSPSSNPRNSPDRRDGLAVLLNIPNQITLARLAIAIVFFGILIADNYGEFVADRTTWLDVALGLFILAAISDFLDGYLARRWNMVSTFGRIADPIVDKVMVCGAFVLLIETSELVPPWFAVLIISREFLISGLRSYLESTGVEFGAASGGKLKMVFQSITIPVVIFQEANYPGSAELRWTAIALLAITALLTVGSSAQYVVKAVRILRQSKAQPKSASHHD